MSENGGCTWLPPKTYPQPLPGKNLLATTIVLLPYCSESHVVATDHELGSRQAVHRGFLSEASAVTALTRRGGKVCNFSKCAGRDAHG